PAEGLGVDEKRITDPIEAGEEIAEAEPPACASGREHPRMRVPVVPSTSQARIGKVMKGNGHISVGGSARVEDAPARNAMTRRSHPLASTMVCARRLSVTAGGRIWTALYQRNGWPPRRSLATRRGIYSTVAAGVAAV